MSEDSNRSTRVESLLDFLERLAYYAAAVFLVIITGMIFYAAVVDLIGVLGAGVLDTTLAILDKILLIFIFVELLSTISTIIRQNQIAAVIAEPFLVVGLIAVVRRILAVTVSIDQSLGTPEFTSLLYELGVLTALIITLSAALYIVRRSERSSGSLFSAGDS